MTERSALLHGMLSFALAGSMAACDGDPSSRADLAAHAEAARQPAELQIGDVTIRASLVPTASLSPAIAQRYGVEPEHGAQLLLVGVRQGPVHEETSVPAQVTARARDLRGVWQDVPIHEVRSEGFIDYAGTARVSPPDTLTFEISVRHAGADAPALLRFSRDVLPR
ncbi:MAG TPA: DUF4426 domain-containing protein [Luteimonas sp.]|nr:DUF4426 domain-containing protein [Luteimonas sp.]